MSKSTKPTKPALRPVVNNLTDEEKELQVARYLANEKKTYFQILLANLAQNPAIVQTNKVTVKMDDGKEHHQFNIIDIVDAALDGADYIIEKMYPVEKKED